MDFDYIKLITLERPWFLIIVCLPFIFILAEKIRTRSLSRYADQALWPWAINISEHHFKSKKILKISAWIFLAIAISSPRLPGFIGSFSEDDIKKRNDISIMLIADFNGINKIDYNYYLIELTDFINNLKGERVGIISLTSSAALISPLTNDYDVSSFYIENLFKITDSNIISSSNNLLKALKIAYKEIKRSRSNNALIIYWSDIIRIEINEEQLNNTKKLIKKLTNIKINVIPIWNQQKNTTDIQLIFESLADNNQELEINNIYQKRISKITSSSIFDREKNYGYQELYSTPLILGLLLLLLSYIPLWAFAGNKK